MAEKPPLAVELVAKAVESSVKQPEQLVDNGKFYDELRAAFPEIEKFTIDGKCRPILEPRATW